VVHEMGPLTKETAETNLPQHRLCHHMRMQIGGGRGEILMGVLLLAALGVGATACSSPGPPSSAPLVSFPSAAAKGLCRSVSVQPIPADEMVALKTRRFREVSGFEGRGRVRHSGSRWRS
jgi:hypothetical protein